jgi:NodT family efflux transporter outer membrane factor (OMF) lipoprotein
MLARWPLLAVLATSAAGCTMAPDARVPQVAAQLPGTYPQESLTGDYRPEAWWRSFEDATLNALVDEALAENLDIAEAAARVERARAQARASRAALLPSLNATGGASYQDNPVSGGFLSSIPGGPDRIQTESYTLGLGASYELDLFGKNRSNLLAARADAAAAAYDFRAVQLAAAAEAISTYFEIVDARRQIELTVLTASLLAERTERTEERFQRGLVQSFELYQVRQDLRNSQASLPLRESALDAAEGRLAVLLRDYPETLKERIAGPLTPRLVFDSVPAGMPSDLLAQRPDVAAAWQRLDSARLAIGARKAERFPSLSLSGSLGTQGGAPDDVFDPGNNWALSLAANVVAPIFDAGRISANIAAARATYDERAAAYARAVLNAYREVQVAANDYEEKRQRYRLILAQLDEAEASLDLQARRFRAGVGDYLAWLDARRAVYQVEGNLSAAARDVALSRLGVHRALGGDWTTSDDFAPVAMTSEGETMHEAGQDMAQDGAE